MNHICTVKIESFDHPSSATVAAAKQAVEKALEPILLGAVVSEVSDYDGEIATLRQEVEDLTTERDELKEEIRKIENLVPA